MVFQEFLAKLGKILTDLNVPYAITGGYAVSVWGRPRATFDIDVVIELFHPQTPALKNALQSLSKLNYLDEGAMAEAVERAGEFNFIDSESGIKIDFWVAGKDETTKLELARRIPETVAGQMVYFISPEDLILSKLRWHKEGGSTRHLEDIESILKIQKSLDLDYLKKQAAKQSTLKILESLKPIH